MKENLEKPVLSDLNLLEVALKMSWKYLERKRCVGFQRFLRFLRFHLLDQTHQFLFGLIANISVTTEKFRIYMSLLLYRTLSYNTQLY